MNPEDNIHIANPRGIKIGDYVYTSIGWKEKFDQQIARIVELEIALIDCRAEYLLFLDKNPNSFAWDFDELSRETQDRYRKDARESLEMEEPLIAIQLRKAEVQIDNQIVRISELETDLAQEEHNSEAFMDEISRLVLYIVDLESKIAALKKIAEEERAAMLACAEDLHGIDEGHLIEARRQLSEEHPEAFK